MFHGKHAEEKLARAADWAGLTLTALQVDRLTRFGEWLITEGTDAGGIGPEEARRIIDRHIADSLVFAGAWGSAPSELLDVGSGVGLPGIPLAITHPETLVTLLDRSARRCRLSRRATRVLGLENVTVEEGDAGAVRGGWPVIVFRASLAPDEALRMARPLLADRGVAVIAASRAVRPTQLPAAPTGTLLDVMEVGVGVLDSPAWLLRMTVNGPPGTDCDPRQ